MTAPRAGLNPTTLSVGFTAKLVTVRSVSPDGQTAITVDRQNTQTQVPMLVQRSKGPLPKPGETWLVTQDLGMWTFAAVVGTSAGQFTTGTGQAVTVSAQAPAGPAEGDIWLDASSGNEIFWWTGTAWKAAQLGTSALADGAVTAPKIASGAITAAQIAPNAGITPAQVAFSPGNRVFTQTAQPQGAAVSDIWINPAANNAVAVWNGGTWTTLPFGPAAIAPASLTSAQLSPAAGITAGQVNFTASSIGGLSVSLSGIQPVVPRVNDLWYDANHNYQLKQWNGSSWVPYKFGTGAIAAGSITAALIAANTITAAQIAAGTITAAQLAAGIIYAGIIDGTVVNAATFVGGTFEGSNFVINSNGSFFYSGSPGPGKLIYSETNVQVTDPYGNIALQGTTSYTNTGTVHAVNLLFGQVRLYTAATQAGPYTQGGYLGPGVNSPHPGDVEIQGTGAATSALKLRGDTPMIDVITQLVAEVGIFAAAPGGSSGNVSAETWHTITLDSGAGWNAVPGYATPSYRLLPDGNIQFAGAVQQSSSFSSTIALNSTHPLPSAYRPTTIRPLCYGSTQGSRARVEFHSDGIIYVIGSPSVSTSTAEIDSAVSML